MNKRTCSSTSYNRDVGLVVCAIPNCVGLRGFLPGGGSQRMGGACVTTLASCSFPSQTTLHKFPLASSHLRNCCALPPLASHNTVHSTHGCSWCGLSTQLITPGVGYPLTPAHLPRRQPCWRVCDPMPATMLKQHFLAPHACQILLSRLQLTPHFRNKSFSRVLKVAAWKQHLLAPHAPVCNSTPLPPACT
jgi:hypothetical protein